jgi:hypothetical protein
MICRPSSGSRREKKMLRMLGLGCSRRLEGWLDLALPSAMKNLVKNFEDLFSKLLLDVFGLLDVDLVAIW